MEVAFTKCHGSGNDFPLIDARAIALDDAAWGGMARALADRGGPVGGDGILLLTAGQDGAAFGMRMFNSDGSEAETCLNGLRCVARAGFEALGIDRATVQLKTSRAEVSRAPDLAAGVYTVRTRAGPASIQPEDVGIRVAAPVLNAPVPGLPSAGAFTGVAMPNPHLIRFVGMVDEAELVALGQWCEARPDLLVDRANVSFVERREGGLFVRTHERGVGLTDACGSAMAASVFAAGLTGRVPFGTTVTVFNPGGLVRGCAEAPGDGGMVTIAGNATVEWTGRVTVDVGSGTAFDLIVTARWPDEVAAWDAVRASAAA